MCIWGVYSRCAIKYFIHTSLCRFTLTGIYDRILIGDLSVPMNNDDGREMVTIFASLPVVLWRVTWLSLGSCVVYSCLVPEWSHISQICSHGLVCVWWISPHCIVTPPLSVALVIRRENGCLLESCVVLLTSVIIGCIDFCPSWCIEIFRSSG